LVCEIIAVERFWGIPAAAEIWFLRVMNILDRLIGSLRGCCHSLPDPRQGGDVRYTMADIGLSAFSLFFMQSPSFLAHQRRLDEGQGRSNCQTLFGLDQILSDNHIRALLDPVSPDHFHPAFAEVVAELEGSGGLEAFRQLGGHVLIALDGTEYHVSGKVHCQQCSTRKRGKDKIELCIPTKSATDSNRKPATVPGSSPLPVHKHSGNFHAARRRFRSRSCLARPYICRFNTFSLLICPSTGLVLHGSARAARTAA